jgi:N-acetylmuramoyl-L-alanine amidase
VRAIRPGDRGDAVRDLQHRLTELGHRIDPAELGGRFGPSTERAVREFQRSRRLREDGVVGPDTWGQLVEAGYRLGDRTLYLRSPAFRGDDVRELQRMLNALGFDAGKEDGIFGHRTLHAVMEFQRNVGARPDGIVGLDTVRTLRRLRPPVGGPGASVVREAEAVRAMGRGLAGSVVAIDPGDPDDIDLTALAGDLAARLADRGAEPALLRGPDAALRARTANALEAALCVGLAGSTDPERASGAHWGTVTSHSPAGRRLAEIVLGELARSGVPTGAVHPLGVALLRETRMPAVLLELPAAALADPGRRRGLAEAIALGIERFLAGAD